MNRFALLRFVSGEPPLIFSGVPLPRMAGLETRVAEVWPDTYVCNTFDPDRGLSFNQYVIDAERPALVHTGGADMLDHVVAGIERVVAVDDLAFAVATHFEADECGALSALLERHPALRPVGSPVTARQLRGFGIHADALVREGGGTLDLGDRSLEFLSYPAEMHLWEGLLAFDPGASGLFSSDVFRRRGRVADLVVTEALAMDDVPPDRCPSDDHRASLVRSLVDLDPRYVAPGHGPVIVRR